MISEDPFIDPETTSTRLFVLIFHDLSQPGLTKRAPGQIWLRIRCHAMPPLAAMQPVDHRSLPLAEHCPKPWLCACLKFSAAAVSAVLHRTE